MKIRPFIIVIVTALAGCAQIPVDDRTTAEAEYREPEAAEGISFSVSGEATGRAEAREAWACGATGRCGLCHSSP